MKKWLFVPVVASLAGCALAQISSRSNQVDAIQFATVGRGAQSAITATEFRVFSDENSWATYYQQMVGNQSRRSLRTPQWADFSRENLVVIHAGQRKSGGFQVLVEGIEKTSPTQVTVRVALQTPPPGAMTTQALTQPWVAVRVRKVAANYVFRAREVQARGSSSGHIGGSSCGCSWCKSAPGPTYILDPIQGLIIVDGPVIINPPRSIHR
ncbi:MAG: protease complex subunit PrcB family protein [Fimbriimonadaceae bacterium]|jgi:hypothetical protein|nr:protease complex subunit PrcB family protein [Fimbriimonadaceae bacterium]